MRTTRQDGGSSVGARLLLLMSLGIVFGACEALAQPPVIALHLFPLTGEVRILNENPQDIQFTFYRLDSPSGALNGTNGVWKSIADTYDAPTGPTPGNGFVDPTNEWLELTPNAMANATNLSEGVIAG